MDEGGVVRAATKLNRVQSNVTTRIRQLEEHVGARLFRREGRSIRLSAEGHTLLVYADRLLRLADEAVSEMRTGKPKGVFRLGSLESTAGSRLAPILSRYHSALPRCGGGAGNRNGRRAGDARDEFRSRGRLRVRAVHGAGPARRARCSRSGWCS